MIGASQSKRLTFKYSLHSDPLHKLKLIKASKYLKHKGTQQKQHISMRLQENTLQQLLLCVKSHNSYVYCHNNSCYVNYGVRSICLQAFWWNQSQLRSREKSVDLQDDSYQNTQTLNAFSTIFLVSAVSRSQPSQSATHKKMAWKLQDPESCKSDYLCQVGCPPQANARNTSESH